MEERNSMIKAVILMNENYGDDEQWIKACENRRDVLTYRVVNITADHWYEQLTIEPYDILLTKPSGLISRYKQLYDERARLIANELKKEMFPTYSEILLHENKRYLSDWLKVNNIPHPETHVFYDKSEALLWTEKCAYPIVAKSSIGASGSGVMIIRSKKRALDYIHRSFSKKGAHKRWGPNLRKGNLVLRAINACNDMSYLKRRLLLYTTRKNDRQEGYVLFQKYIPHEFEWRVVRIGESYFAHKKVKLGDKASGSLLKQYDNPPLDILDFVRMITDTFGLFSQAVDIFESDNGYLVNEMQCIFGQSDPYQMLVNGRPGRYFRRNDEWIFEVGDFNTNECYDLRLDTAIQLYVNGASAGL